MDCRKPSTWSGVTTYWPSGLFMSLAILAINLFGAMPAETVMPMSALTRRRISCAISVALPRQRRQLETSRKGLVQRQRFDQVGVIGKDFVHAFRCLAIHRHAARDQDQIRAALQGGRARHRRAHPELARLVTRGGDDAAPAGTAANGDRLAAQARVIAHLDGRVKAVRVDVDDFTAADSSGFTDRLLASGCALGKNHRSTGRVWR